MTFLRVLITDDEMGMRLGAERTLRRFTVQVPDVNEEVSFVIEQAETGEDALKRIEKQPPDILLLDHKLPGISGLEVLDQIVGQYPQMLIVMITAYASIETAVTATKRGAYDFLAKPFTPDELKSTVRKAAARIVLAKQARKLAEEKRQVRFQFISVLAHELKAPLNAVQGYLNILKDPKYRTDVASVNQMVERCLVRTEGMHKLIYDLLDLTRIESGLKQRHLEEVDVTEVARVAIDTVLPSAEEKGITIELGRSTPLRMTADRGELEIILNNLLSNAVKYNRPNGRVDVRLAEQTDEIVLTVADTGIGMSTEECGKLFQDFVRIKNAKTSNILGSGLGLSTVRKLAHLYEGDASVESEMDVGSTFTVRLQRGHENPLSMEEASAGAGA